MPDLEDVQTDLVAMMYYLYRQAGCPMGDTLQGMRDEFREDNDITLYDFALECFANAAAMELPKANIGYEPPLPKLGTKGIRDWAPMIEFDEEERDR